MNPKPDPEWIDEENPEWTEEMFAQAKPMKEVDPELAAISVRARGRAGPTKRKQRRPQNMASMADGLRGFSNPPATVDMGP